MSKVSELKDKVESAFRKLCIDDKAKELETLKKRSEHKDFWSDNQKAAGVMQKINSITELVEPWINLKKDINDLSDLEQMKDDSLSEDISKQYELASKKFEALRKVLRFNGKYDASDTVLSIHAGAGGTDAQDWAQMLLRMYGRWAEDNDVKVTLLDESAGEEAGIKSVSMLLEGSFIYGKLRGESGVHRLVRLSPFNANNLRQTSFAKVEIVPKIDTDDEVPIDEKDLKIDVFRSGGRGGQSVNTTDSAVRITHEPTGIVVSIQNERSQIQNKETAMTILRSKLAQLQQEQHAESLADIKGPNKSAEWGNQIRSYVLHPYTMVKDLRTKHETTQAESVLNGDLNQFIDAYLEEDI